MHRKYLFTNFFLVYRLKFFSFRADFRLIDPDPKHWYRYVHLWAACLVCNSTNTVCSVPATAVAGYNNSSTTNTHTNTHTVCSVPAAAVAGPRPRRE
jgi:hypothetical protein